MPGARPALPRGCSCSPTCCCTHFAVPVCGGVPCRTKDVIKSGGEWLSSIQLENTAMGHPKVGSDSVSLHAAAAPPAWCLVHAAHALLSCSRNSSEQWKVFQYRKLCSFICSLHVDYSTQ